MLKIMKASAGSGKTYSLTRTYISLLLRNDDRYAYRHILAVTFTNKATDEMKSRILKELHVMATDTASSAYLKDFVPSVFPSEHELQVKAKAVLQDILHDYSAFAVSTIDKFFQQTLKAFSREIGQFASYQVELDKGSLVAESVDRILDSLTENSGSLLKWLTDNVLEQIEQGGRYSMDANLLNMAIRLKSPQRQEILEKEKIDEDKAYDKQNLMNIRNVCRQIKKDFRDEVKSKAARALGIMRSAGVEPADSNRGFLKALDVYNELGANDSILPPTSSFMTKAMDSEQWFSRAKKPTLLHLVFPFLEAPLEDFCALWEKEYQVYNTACILDKQIYGLGVAGELRNTFVELMKEKNVLCLDDSNTILRDIIDGSDAPFVYEKLGVRFDHFLLDEFQDTANVQWTNFRPLLLNSDSQGGENLIVGDVKQSIYRWRGSDWKLLDMKIPSEFPEYEEEVLDTNYRSLPNVVDFNNKFFVYAAEILDKAAGFDGDGPMQRIYSDVEQKIAKKGTGSVELTYCPAENELDEVLKSVRKALDAGAALSDIAVLVRSNESGSRVAAHLIANDIPVITDEALKVKSSITVRRIVSLMSCVDNPDNTVSGFLADALDISVPHGSSSLVDMAEELIRGLKQNEEDGFRDGEAVYVQSFMDCLQDYVSSNGNSLRGFLKHWEGLNPSICSPSTGSSVKVMTIHKSKGLDFPYVIIPFAENITLYKAGSSWCVPNLSGTQLDGVANGVYDVVLSQSSESTLFAEDFHKEYFLQQVDNINTLYVAMTRAAKGMHIIAKTPSAKFLSSVGGESVVQFADFSQILYMYAVKKHLDSTSDGDSVSFNVGEMVDFAALRKVDENPVEAFPVGCAGEYPSIALNPQEGDAEEDVRERGRLKFSADSLDFFSEDGQAGVSASNRIKGVVLHDVLSSIVSRDDLDKAVEEALLSGILSADEARDARELLCERLESVSARGWFPEDRDKVLNEVNVIDTDGQILRPDRVVKDGGKVMIIDYKFGEHYPKYERQMTRYADVWRRMGYEDVSAWLWYVQTGEIMQVV
jgi:ATP-dependent exoDNAse (exonuclease V) beta subunit